MVWHLQTCSGVSGSVNDACLETLSLKFIRHDCDMTKILICH